MCDTDNSFTERAKGWITDKEPTPDEIQSAYRNMLAMLAKNPDAANEDTDECLDLLLRAFQSAGGPIDDLLANVKPSQSAPIVAVEPESGLDCSPLYEVADAPIVELSPSEKLVEFQRLKSLLQNQGGA